MVFADLICRALQKKVFQLAGTPLPVNSFEPRSAPADKLREDGIRYVSDITYPSRYPNNHLDISYCPEPGAHPTVIYFHGGGFIFGDKVSGDPLAAKGEETNYLPELVRRGYNLVNVNYALAPEYRYPAQILQMNEAIAFCVDNAEKLRLDMQRVFLCGGSAGAIMTEIYGLAVVEEGYAAEFGMKVALPSANLLGLVIDESATDYLHFHDFRMTLMFNTWMGTNSLKKCEWAKPLVVPQYIKNQYPPSCIISSNLEHFFPDAARQLKEKLDAIGGEYAYYYRPQETEKLEHGFMNRYRTSQCAGEAFELTMAFMETHSENKQKRRIRDDC